MEKIDLNTRDRRNIYATDADNVAAYEVSIDENVDIQDLDAALGEVSDQMKQRGNRFGYIVLKITY